MALGFEMPIQSPITKPIGIRHVNLMAFGFEMPNTISYNEPIGIRHVNLMAFGFEMPTQSLLLRSLSVVFGSEICCLSFGAAFVALCFGCCHCKSGASSAQNKEQQKPPLMFSFFALIINIIISIPLDLRPKSSLVGFETGVWKGETTRTRRGENDQLFCVSAYGEVNIQGCS